MKWLVPSNQKLVPFLQEELGSQYSGKMIRRILEANLCRINGKVERFGSTTVEKGDRVELAPSWKSLLKPILFSFQTVYEDDFLKIVSKPTGWVCEDREALRSFGPRHYLVHRLDKDTTGLLILAKSHESKEKIGKLFEQRKIHKTYLALVDGVTKDKEGVRQSFFAKKGSFQGQTVWGSSHKGLTAITRWKSLKAGLQASLVQCEPVTGRTHQIRVHLSEMGHPILTDRQYASSFRSSLFANRPLLHSFSLSFIHPILEARIDCTAPIPSDFSEALKCAGIDYYPDC